MNLDGINKHVAGVDDNSRMRADTMQENLRGEYNDTDNAIALELHRRTLLSNPWVIRYIQRMRAEHERLYNSLLTGLTCNEPSPLHVAYAAQMRCIDTFLRDLTAEKPTE